MIKHIVEATLLRFDYCSDLTVALRHLQLSAAGSHAALV